MGGGGAADSGGAGAARRVAFGAYDEPLKRQAAVKSGMFKVALVAGDCVLLGLQPVLVHMSKNADGGYAFSPIAVNLLTELAKTAFALATLMALGTGRSGRPMYRSLRAFVADARHNRLLIVPAALYAVNNYLKFAMQLYFRPTATKMLGNLKVFSIALLMRLVMRRRFTVIQYEALFLLVAGITVNQLRTCGPHAADAALPPGALLPAVLCVLGSVTVPSAASVYNEYALKRHMDTSVHLQNFFLYFYGAAFNAIGALVGCLVSGDGLEDLFEGQSWVTLALIVNNAAQGILSSFFYKFADTILKKYSSTIATIWTALLSWALFSHPLTVNFALGVSIIFVSMHQFFTFGDKKGGGGGSGGAHAHLSDPGGGGGGGGIANAAAAGAGSRAPGVLALPPGAATPPPSSGWATPQMLHSPSMEHIAVSGGGAGGGGGGVSGVDVIAALASGAETGSLGGGGGSGSGRAPLLPR